MKTVDFSESIAACDLKDCTCRQLIELMKVSEYCRSRSFLAVLQVNVIFECKLSCIGNQNL